MMLPSHLPDHARNSWPRIWTRMLVRGRTTGPDFLLACMAASSVGLYALASTRGIPAADLEHSRTAARDLLREAGVLEHAHVAVLDSEGRDPELLALAAPWPTLRRRGEVDFDDRT